MRKNTPKFSIITPSLNQVFFIEETIKSVLSQKNVEVEYIIIDGGSTDGTVDIIKKYGRKIKWISEKDSGQTNALNKGLRIATGEIVGYLNADDIYLSGALELVNKYFVKNPDMKWVTGKAKIVDKDNNEIRGVIKFWKDFWLKDFFNKFRKNILLVLNYIPQPSTFWRRCAMEEIGFFDEKYSLSMDYDYWLRLFSKFELGIIKADLSAFRVHQTAKSSKYLKKQLMESRNISVKYGNNDIYFQLHKIHDLFTEVFYKFNL